MYQTKSFFHILIGFVLFFITIVSLASCGGDKNADDEEIIAFASNTNSRDSL